jgi:YgiT-type zinc finger domain-containing protein
MDTQRDYPCEFCDTDKPQEAREVIVTMTNDGRWYIFENVPAMVCPNCGHAYYDGPLLLRLEDMMTESPEQGHPVEAWSFSLPKSGEVTK